ncbi:hypothetical protein HBI47_237250 [Parastagonospora nodorum]|nr:hypothetical protein HBI47_237250 [Parastagonospora nodorum]
MPYPYPTLTEDVPEGRGNWVGTRKYNEWMQEELQLIWLLGYTHPELLADVLDKKNIMYVECNQSDQILYKPFDPLFQLKEPRRYALYIWSIGIPVYDPNVVPLTNITIIWHPDRPAPRDIAVFSLGDADPIYFPNRLPRDHLSEVYRIFSEHARNKWMPAWINGTLIISEMVAVLTDLQYSVEVVTQQLIAVILAWRNEPGWGVQNLVPVDLNGRDSGLHGQGRPVWMPNYGYLSYANLSMQSMRAISERSRR